MFLHTITLADGAVLDSSTIRSVTLTEQVSDQDDLCPGAACAACAEIELWAPENGLNVTQGAELTLTRIDTESGAQETVGVFLAEKPVKTSANVVKVTAYDRMTLLDKDLSPWLREQQGDFPLTLKELVEAVCAQCGVTLADGALDGALNTGYAVQAFYADSLTGRQLIQWAAQAMGRFARMTPAGALEFAWYTGFAGYTIGPGSDAVGVPTALGLLGPVLGTVDGLVWTFRQPQNGYFQGGLSYEDYETAPIDKVQIKQSDDDVGVLYPPDETGTNALVIQGNLLLTTASADALRPVAQALYEQLQGVTYTPLEVSLPLTADAPAPGQIIAVTDAWGRSLRAYVMQRTVSGQRMTLTCTGNARRDSTAAVNSQTYQNLQGKMLELQLGVDGLKVTASELQGDYAQLQLTVDGLASEVADVQGNVSRLSQTVAGISTEVSNVQGDMTRLEQTVDGLELTVVKDGEVRTAFAADSTSVTINSGRITFSGNTLVVNSTNFKLSADGTVKATGDFVSTNGTDIARLDSGSLTFTRKIATTGATATTFRVWSYGGNAGVYGRFQLEGTINNGSQGAMITANTTETGGLLNIHDGFGSPKVKLFIENGVGRLICEDGRIDTKVLSTTDLDAWGNKNRIVPTGFGNLKMGALETPEPTFADSGHARCGEDGLCHLTTDPRYAETIDRRKVLQWLATPTAPGALWVETIDGGAVVHGQPGQTFDWLCLGAQAGYAGVYAALHTGDPPKGDIAL